MNLIPLDGCHFMHHNGNPEISARYRKVMESRWGKDWEDELIAMSHQIDKRTDKEWRAILLQIIDNFKLQ